ncbi:MAG: hypothetical protein U5K69_12605 [Balneolaceae bacterium]|nr:hypothetical protein [Balneolaceae bacterium]
MEQTAPQIRFRAVNMGCPLPVRLARSWIQSFDDELTAFRTFARQYPNNTTLAG